MDLVTVVTELRAIEERYAPAGGASREAYAKQLADGRAREADREEVCNTGDATAAWIVLLLCSRYGVRPFRRRRQKPTTICVHVPAGFMSKVFWPQVTEMATAFERARRAMVDEVATAWLGRAAAEETFFVDEVRAAEG
jgi:hypothetical protein